MNGVGQIAADYNKFLNEQCLESLKLDSVDLEEKRFKKSVIYEGYMNLEKLGLGTSLNKVKIVYNPECVTLDIGIYEANKLKYYMPIKFDWTELRKMED